MIRLPSNPDAYTDATARFVEKLNARFPEVQSLGIYNRRPIAGTSTWSQHSWGNAVDITTADWLELRELTPAHYALLDEVYEWIMANYASLAARYVLWRRPSHYNHIHIDFHPKGTGTPPVLGADSEEAELKEYIAAVQRSLNAAGFTDYEGKVLTVDGVLGKRTESAIAKRDVAAADVVAPSVELEVDTVRVVKGVRLASS